MRGLDPRWLTLLCGLTIGCGGEKSSSGFGRGSSDDGSAGSNIDAGWAAAPLSPSCPASPASVGQACDIPDLPDLQCEYGDSPWSVGCDTVLQCNAGTWAVAQPDAESGCQPRPAANPAACPSPYVYPGPTAACSPAGTSCEYPAGAGCSCATQSGTTTWTCFPQAGCPTSRPRLGTACSGTAASNCWYLSKGCGYIENCIQGFWQGGDCGF